MLLLLLLQQINLTLHRPLVLLMSVEIAGSEKRRQSFSPVIENVKRRTIGHRFERTTSHRQIGPNRLKFASDARSGVKYEK